jgi:subfamily B ATP-binding cassette protein MsbA
LFWIPGSRLTARPGMTPAQNSAFSKSLPCFSLKKPDPTGKERRMFGNKFRSKLADPDSAHALVYRLLTEQALGLWRRYAIAFALMAVGAAATALCAYLVGNVINAAYVDRNLPGIFWLALLTAALFLVKSLAGYGHAVMLAQIGNRIIALNQRRMFDALIAQNLAFFSERHSSEFMARLTTGAAAASTVINLMVTSIGRDLLSLIALVAVMFYQDAIMSLIAFFVAPPAFILLRKMIRRIYAIARNQFHGGARILETLQETVQGIRIVKAFTLEEVMRARLEQNVAELENESNKWARVAHRAGPLMEALGGFAIAGALIYGGFRVLETGATPGQFFSFLTAFMLAYEPAKRLARLNIELNSGLVGVRILFDIIDSPPTEPADSDKPALKITDARVEFDNVLFGYRPAEVIIRNMTFTVEPGKMTALVGPSGGGKSTVFNLMLRFYEPTSGAITIDGQNITQVSRRSLRGQVAYVGQDVFLFHGTIRDNIAIGKPGASEDEIIAAAKAAHAHEFICAFPQGYDTQVGERGTQLSGGERARVAIARALIKNAQIILLDEATAALDSESERLVQEAMDYLCQGRTSIAIAHRLHTITHADRILVVESGAIVESGRHDELLRKNGRYAAFYRLQIKEEQEPPPPISIATA